jgi:predicted RNA methylase
MVSKFDANSEMVVSFLQEQGYKVINVYIAFLRQVRYIFMAEILMGQELVVPHQSRKRYSPGTPIKAPFHGEILAVPKELS